MITTGQRLISLATEYDRKQEGKPGHNIYALGMYFRACNCALAMHEKHGVPIEDAIQAVFLDRLQSHMLKGMGYKVASREVIRNGRPDLRKIRESCWLEE